MNKAKEGTVTVVDLYRAFKDLSITCVLCQITDALECPSLFRQGPLS